MNEPTAAVLTFGLQTNSHNQGERHVLVFDLGGGTFDVTIVTVEDGIFEVKSTSGDTHLGGRDFDKRGADFLIQQERKGIDTKEPAYHKLSVAFERAKHTLSSSKKAEVSDKALDLETSVTRARFVLFVCLFVDLLLPQMHNILCLVSKLKFLSGSGRFGSSVPDS